MHRNRIKLAHEVVIERIEKFLTAYPDRKDIVQIVGMGCGMAEIAHHFHDRPLLKIINVDNRRTQHVPTHIEVIEMDMSKISQKCHPKSIDFLIFCLSLSGTKENVKNYLTEAKKILKDSGKIIIIEKRNNKINNEVNLISIIKEDELFTHRNINNAEACLSDKYSLMILSPVND